MDTVGNLQTTVLAHILDSVNQFASHTFLTQFIGQLDFQSHSKVSFVGYEPSGNILTDNLHVGSLNHSLLSFHIQCDRTVLLQGIDLLL